MEESRVRDFAARYAAAWSSGDPAAVAGFFCAAGLVSHQRRGPGGRTAGDF